MSGLGRWSYKDGDKCRWDGNGYRTPEFDNTWGYCWRDSRHISIRSDFISFHKMPYDRECITSVITLEVLSYNPYDTGTIQL